MSSPVHDTRPDCPAYATKVGAERQHGVGKGTRGMSGRRMDRHPRRLVDHQDLRVLVDDAEREFLRHQIAFDRVGDVHGYLSARTELRGGQGGGPVHRDVSLGNQALDLGARQVSALPGQEQVEPSKRPIGREMERLGHWARRALRRLPWLRTCPPSYRSRASAGLPE